MTADVNHRPPQRKPQPVDEELMTCWYCGHRGVLRIVGGLLVVVHGRAWICRSPR